jgi:transposase
MATPYSQDLRDRVLAAYGRGMATAKISEVFCVSASWARRVRQRRREHGETRPRKMGSPGVGKIDRTRLAELVRAQPDATGPELRERLGVECTESAVYQALKELGLTLKKRRSMPPSRTGLTSPSTAPTGVPARRISTPHA